MDIEKERPTIVKRLPQITGPRLFFGYVGTILVFIGALMLVPLILLIFFRDPESLSTYSYFLIPGLGSIGLGLLLYFTLAFKKRKGQLKKWESYLLLLFLWIVAIIIGAVPYIMCKRLGLTFSESIFESASGFTTTALSIYSETVEELGPIFQFYRCWMLFVGGIGLTLIVTSALSDANGLALYNLEGHNDRLLPNLMKSARLIFLIYIGYIVLGFIAYVCCGMTPFDAVCHSISAISTGGYSTHSAGLSYYNSVGVEAVTCVLMILGATNFIIHFALIRRKFKSFFYHCEFMCAVILLLLFLPIAISGFDMVLKIAAAKRGWPEFNNTWIAVRYGVFYYFSIITTTGFQIDPCWVNPDRYQAVPTLFSFYNLPTYMSTSIVILMFVGGQVGSTSGGMKQMRIVEIFKQCYWHIRGLVDDSHIVHTQTIVRYGKKDVVKSRELNGSAAFVLVFIAVTLLFTFAFTCCYPESDLVRFDLALFTSLSVLTNSGVASGVLIVHGAPAAIYWLSTIGMIIGRLEPMIFVLIFVRGFKSAYEKGKQAITLNKLKK